MEQFDKLVSDTYKVLIEQPVPPAPPAIPPAGASPAGDGIDPAGMNPALASPSPPAPASEMSDVAKKEVDPIAYVENMLTQLIDPKEGISPDMFDQFLNTFDIAAAKIEDKPGFVKFYREFYERLKYVMETKEELSDMFKTFQSTMKDLISNKSQEPDEAGGGIGKAGPSGPGVK